MNLTNNTKLISVMDAVAAGTTDQTSSTVDTQGYEGVRFMAKFGAITAGAVTSIYARQGAASDMSDAADLKDTRVSVADTDDNKLAVLDIFRPQERYVNCIVDRGTQNAVIDSVVAELYGAHLMPVTKDTTVAAQEIHASPIEGTP